MCTRSIRSVLLFFCALLLFACAAVAQTIQDGTIEGTVRDTTGAAIGNASVNVESASLVGGPQAAHTDAGGGYRVVGLPSGTYLVIADARGFGNVRRADINLAPGRSVTVDIVLPVAGFEQRTTVSAEPVAADTRSTSTSIVIGKTMLENLPLQRDVTALINLAPGVKNFAALGGAVLGNPLQIDDMSANHPNVGTPAVFPNLYWVQEAQMIGAGADARYGGYTGMLMNLVTRSETDTFTGMAQ
ncbi:MAG TPA: carboxypeptidase-like regulatory domain-containing protein, partial [Vicinamibacterales bacterium]|nr:carboxypeptidase-like regulatory domain-containing protein [Vicinamibacterales bacterium]